MYKLKWFFCVWSITNKFAGNYRLAGDYKICGWFQNQPENGEKRLISPSIWLLQVVELDLGTVVPSCSGPKRPHDRVAVSELQEEFRTCLSQKVSFKGFGLPADKLATTVPFVYEGVEYTLNHGMVWSVYPISNITDPRGSTVGWVSSRPWKPWKWCKKWLDTLVGWVCSNKQTLTNEVDDVQNTDFKSIGWL